MVLICVLSLCGLLSCGLEEFYYIEFIPEDNTNIYDTNAIINLPSSGYEGYTTYFENFIIFYRIYISGGTPVQTSDLKSNSTDRALINQSLNADFNAFYPLTVTTSTSVPTTSNLETTFGNRSYYVLNLENDNINSILGSGSLGQALAIAFPPNPGVEPTLTLNNGVPYTLRRAASGATPAGQSGQSAVLNPRPNRNLLNSSALYNNDNITNFNTDTVAYTVNTPRYTYISMYIAAKGYGGMPPLPIYSQPTFIGIFRLADSG